MGKAIACLAASVISVGSQAGTVQSYDLIPQLIFSHDLSGCQYFFEKPVEGKKSELKARVFETCNQKSEFKELLGDYSYTSKIEWYAVRCASETVAWEGGIRFDRQFWRGPGETSWVKEVKEYDFQRPHELLRGLFKRLCDPTLRRTPTT